MWNVGDERFEWEIVLKLRFSSKEETIAQKFPKPEDHLLVEVLLVHHSLTNRWPFLILFRSSTPVPLRFICPSLSHESYFQVLYRLLLLILHFIEERDHFFLSSEILQKKNIKEWKKESREARPSKWWTVKPNRILLCTSTPRTPLPNTVEYYTPTPLRQYHQPLFQFFFSYFKTLKVLAKFLRQQPSELIENEAPYSRETTGPVVIMQYRVNTVSTLY